MEPATYNFNIDLKSDFSHSYTYKSGGVAVNLTGATIKHVFNPIGADSFEWSTANGKIALSDPTSGIFSCSIPQSEVAGLDFQKATHELIIILQSGETRRLFKGSIYPIP